MFCRLGRLCLVATAAAVVAATTGGATTPNNRSSSARPGQRRPTRETNALVGGERHPLVPPSSSAHNNNNHRAAFDEYRGGSTPDQIYDEIEDMTSTTTNSALVPASPTLQQQQQPPPSLEDEGGKSIASRVTSVRTTTRRIKRTEFVAVLLLRISFILLFPFAILFLIISTAISTLFTAFRIITLNFICRDVSRIAYATTRATLALLLACICGLFSPYFAVFGFLAAVSLSALETAEPILRIRYKRQMRKIRHLHKLITDPVLLDTLGVVMRGAHAVALVSAKAAEQQTERAVLASKEMGRKSLTASKKMGRTIGKTAKQTKEKVDQTSTELIDTLLQTANAAAAKAKFEKSVPKSVALWANDQFESLRKSGALEAAASRALLALRKEMVSAAEFLPYLEAIEMVRKKQMAAGKEMEELNQKKKKKEKENGGFFGFARY